MSYDLTIKSDDRYSKSSDAARLGEFIVALPHVRRNGPDGFLLDDGQNRWMEIDLECWPAEEEEVEVHEGLLGEGLVNCVRLHIPYPNLGNAPERDYFPVALAIARFPGWKLYDEQTNEYIKDEEKS